MSGKKQLDANETLCLLKVGELLGCMAVIPTVFEKYMNFRLRGF